MSRKITTKKRKKYSCFSFYQSKEDSLSVELSDCLIFSGFIFMFLQINTLLLVSQILKLINKT
jgi:hypothetical protein